MKPSWQETYFEVAKVIAKRSDDPKTKVGAVIVKDGVIIGTGYNGNPRGFSDEIDWNSDAKYDYVIHAEMNAIANAQSVGVPVVGADIYVTLSPCHECIKLLIQNRIKNVYYLDEYRDIELTKKIASKCNINIEKVDRGKY